MGLLFPFGRSGSVRGRETVVFITGNQQPAADNVLIVQAAGYPLPDPGIMELKELEKRMHEFVDGQGWYEVDSPKVQSPKNLAVSLSIEAAEVLEHFQWREETADKAELAGELADVALYLLQLASISGIDLEQAILDKLAYNKGREWSAS